MFCPTPRADADLRPGRGPFHPEHRKVKPLTLFLRGRCPRIRRRTTLFACRHRVNVRRLRTLRSLRRRSCMPRLTPSRLLTRLSQTSRPFRLAITVTGRRFAAVPTVLFQSGRSFLEHHRPLFKRPSPSLQRYAYAREKLYHRLLSRREGAVDSFPGGQPDVHAVKE